MKLSKKQTQDILWNRGELSWKFHSGQMKIESAYNQVSKKLFVANASRRLGKSFWASCKVVETAIKRKSQSIIATAFHTDLVRIILPMLDTIFADCPAYLRPVFKKQESCYKFSNGSIIYLVGLDKKPDGLRGNRLDGLILLDEAGFIANLNHLYSRVLVPATMNTPARIIMISTPPIAPDHPFKMFCEKAKAEDAYIKLTIYDNPMVTPQMIDEYRRECLTDSDFLREYCCEFVVDEASSILAQEFDYNTHTFDGSLRDKNFTYYRKYCCFDVGVKDPTFFIFAYYDYGLKKLIIEAEEVLQHQDVTTENINNILTNTAASLDYTSVDIIADNNNLILINDLNLKYKKSVRTVRKDNLQAMIAELREQIKAGNILISRSCTKLISQIQNGIWNKSKTDFARQSGHHNDGIAALNYLSRSLNEYTDPVPTTYNPYTHYINQTAPSKSTLELAKLFKLK